MPSGADVVETGNGFNGGLVPTDNPDGSNVASDSYQVVLSKDYLDETTVLQIYAKHLGFEFRKSLEGTKVPPDFVERVPITFARNYNLIALDVGSDGVLKVATCSPLGGSTA